MSNIELYKVITKNDKSLTLRGLEDRNGKYLFINDKKEYFFRYNPITNISNPVIKSMIRVCPSCKTPIYFTNGLQCTHVNCDE